MTILCGTDFSPDAKRASQAAACLARARRTRVRLVYALDMPGAAEALAEPFEVRGTQAIASEIERIQGLLAAEVAELAAHGAPVDTEILAGRADEAIVRCAVQREAELVVVGAIGQHGQSLLSLGGTADRVAQVASCPVWVVRDEQAWCAWSRGEGLLRVFVCLDRSATADAAVSWLPTLWDAGSCQVVAGHVYWPPVPVGSRGSAPGTGRAAVEARIESELRARFEGLVGKRAVELQILGGWGRPAEHLAQLAREQHADVLVVGTHQRSRAGRVWHGSVSRDAIVAATMDVIIVPGDD